MNKKEQTKQEWEITFIPKMPKKEFSRLTPTGKKGIVTQITNYPKPKTEPEAEPTQVIFRRDKTMPTEVNDPTYEEKKRKTIDDYLGYGAREEIGLFLGVLVIGVVLASVYSQDAIRYDHNKTAIAIIMCVVFGFYMGYTVGKGENAKKN